MKKRNYLTVFFLIFILSSCKKEETIWYQFNGDQLYTEAQADSIVETRNKIMKDKNLDMVFSKVITDTITKENQIIYKFNLKGESTLVTENTNSYEEMIGKTLPEFSLTNLNGDVINSQDLIGKPLVINMWFTKCPPCIAEMPELNKIKAEVENADVQFIAMTYEDKAKVNKFLETKAFNFQHVVDAKDYCEKFTKQYPINIFVNREGVIHHIEGGMPLIYDAKARKITDKVNPKNFIKALKEIKG